MAEFRNPNLQGQGGDGSGGDSRGMMTFTLLAVALFFAFQYFVKPKQPAAPAQTAQTEQQPQAVTAPAASAQAAGPAAQAQAAGQSQPAAPAPTPTIAAAAMTTTTVENGDLKIVFTNQGAQAEHWILLGKQYLDHSGPGSEQLDLIDANNPALPENIRNQLRSFGLPLSLYTYEPALTQELNSALYQVSVTGTKSASGVFEAPCTITYHYAANGVDAVKSFHLDKNYVVSAQVEVKRNGVPVRALLAWPGGLGDQSSLIQFATGKFSWSVAGKDDSTKAAKISGDNTLNLPYDYAAVNDLYFAAAFLPDSPERATVVTLHHAIELPTGSDEGGSQKKPADVIGLAMGDTSGITRLRFYAGPKALDILKSIHATGPDGKTDGPSLEPLIQFGALSIVAKPLYLALRFLHSHMGNAPGNWGWAIIIVTTIFTVVMLPFRFMALKSSLGMMRIQPKAEAIKNRYAHLKATDPKRAEMNAETMALYKAEGVNMYGSCLPMLPQIPLFWAYFEVLENAVELRQAHWLWLTDLSAPDPTYVLPILIIVSMFLTQYITPSPGMDPSQRRMMAFIMPIFFGFMLLHYASGLALYWGTSNVISLAMQLFVNQSPMGKEMHALAEKRAAKKTGPKSKTIQARR